MSGELKLIHLSDYAPLIGEKGVERILKKASRLRGRHVTNVNSTFYGGGVAEILTSLTLLMNDIGIKTGWRVIQGVPDFFAATKKMHNALQGGSVPFRTIKRDIYEHVNLENSIRMHFPDDIVVIHDPQPLPLIRHFRKGGPWIWRCHIDLSKPHPQLWRYLRPIVDRYDAVIFSIKEYRQKLRPPQVFFMPAINPFSIKNRDMSEKEIDKRLKNAGIPTDLPIVAQISRFDKWKDPEGVIKAFKIARKKVDATLVLLGNAATDDPEGSEVFEQLLKHKDERILLLATGDDTGLVNALQRRAAVILQKSTREGFGLTVTEAMWKGTPVIGGNVGGIRYQIDNGKNGYLVSSVEEAAERMVTLLKNPALRRRMGKRAKEKVREHFLLTRLMEQYLDLFNSFETVYKLRK